ncbi:hypothetical protein [Nonomuraea sediminis]|uniref:hypothetical protein n=1 Tax=Nonomuraea sediminis TaxID=2835864 RepID=UPI001BDD8FDA|nr:hypothetical protein [Nonomuraea sediminis]
MSRVIMLVIGALAAMFVLFTFILPLLATLLKVALLVAVVGVIVFIAVRVMSGSGSSSSQ